MGKKIITHSNGVVETRETFYTEETVNQLKQQLVEKDKEIKKLNWQLKDKDFIIKNLNHSLSVAPNAGQRARIDELTKIVKEKDKEIETLKQELEEINAGYDFTYEQSSGAIKELKQNQTQLAIHELEKVKELLLDEYKKYPIVYDKTNDIVAGALDRDKVNEIIDQQINELRSTSQIKGDTRRRKGGRVWTNLQ